MSVSHESVTQLLQAMRDGDERALDKLFARVYEELHNMARQRRRNWVGGDYTLNTTALVHEVYIKMADQSSPEWNSRAHFMGVAAKAMRHILINYAEKRRTKNLCQYDFLQQVRATDPG